jgi:hypothetical protein
MKKILIPALVALYSSVSAQYVTPRAGTGANNDNTFRSLTYKQVTVTPPNRADTVNLNLNAYNTQLRVSNLVTDSLVFNFNSVAYCYSGDQVWCIVVNPDMVQHVVTFLPNHFQAKSLADTIPAFSTQLGLFMFDGTQWVSIR